MGGAGGVGAVNGGRLLNVGVVLGGQGGAGGASTFASHQAGGAGGTGGAGVQSAINGYVTNYGSLQGGAGGAGHDSALVGGAGGNGGDGVDMQRNGTLINRGLIAGGGGGAGGLNQYGHSAAAGAAGVGVYAGPAGGVVLDNAGTITGGAYSVVLRSAADLLIVEFGAQFIGGIVGGGGTLELSGGQGVIGGLGGAGRIAGSDSAHFSGFGVYGLDIGTRWSLIGKDSLGAGQQLIVRGTATVKGTLTEATGALLGVTGTLQFQGPSQTLAGTVANGGMIVVEATTLTLTGTVNADLGTWKIDDGVLAATRAFTDNVNFAGASGVLALGQSQSFSGVVSFFAAGGQDVLDLGDISFVGPGQASFSGNATNGVLTVSDGSHTATIKLNGDYLGDSFTASSDGHGGVDIVAAVGGGASRHAFATAMAAMVAGGAGPLASPTERQPPSLAILAAGHGLGA